MALGTAALLAAGGLALLQPVTQPRRDGELRTVEPHRERSVATTVLLRQQEQCLRALTQFESSRDALLDALFDPARQTNLDNSVPTAVERLKLIGGVYEVRGPLGLRLDQWESEHHVLGLEVAIRIALPQVRAAAKPMTEPFPPPPRRDWVDEWTAFYGSLAPLADALEALRRSCLKRGAELESAAPPRD